MEQKKKNLLKKIVWALVIVAIVGGLVYLGLRQEGCRKSSAGGPVIRHDTVLVKEIIRDTIIKWYERVKWKESEPETIWVSPDTLDVDTIWGRWPEAIISLDKRGRGLTFSTITPVDSGGKAVAKTYFHRIGKDFSIRAQGEGFFVKTTTRFWDNWHAGIRTGADLYVWRDSTTAIVDPYVGLYLGWGPFTAGPKLSLHGLAVDIQADWRF